MLRMLLEAAPIATSWLLQPLDNAGSGPESSGLTIPPALCSLGCTQEHQSDNATAAARSGC